MSSSNCCFLTCIQISQEAGQVVWYSHLFQNFPQFTVIHTVKGFGIVNKAEIDVLLELSCFFHDPADVGNLISGSSAFSKTSLNIWKFMVHILLKPNIVMYCPLKGKTPLQVLFWAQNTCVTERGNSFAIYPIPPYFQVPSLHPFPREEVYYITAPSLSANKTSNEWNWARPLSPLL